MSDKQMQASSPIDLRNKIMTPNVLKSEAEWWAFRKIEELEYKVAELGIENKRLHNEWMKALGRKVSDG